MNTNSNITQNYEKPTLQNTTNKTAIKKNKQKIEQEETKNTINKTTK